MTFQPGATRGIYAGYFLFAVISAYVISQSGPFATAITISAMLLAILLWRKKRRQDFRIANYLARVFISLFFAFVFSAAFVIVRAKQPENYRTENLAGLAIVSVVLAGYFALTGNRTAS